MASPAVTLIRSIDWAHQHVRAHLPDGTDAVELYERAALVAERRGDDTHQAIAAVLRVAAEHRRTAGLHGVLGEREATLALALSVFDGRLSYAAE